MYQPRKRARGTRSLVALLVIAMGVAVDLGGPAQAAPSQPPAFVGYCTPGTGGDGTCILDEPMGQNPATHGTVTYDRTVNGGDDTISFDLPNDVAGAGVQVCITRAAVAPTNPYIPTLATTCAGTSSDRAYAEQPTDDPVVVDLDDFFGVGYTDGEKIWFTLHVSTGMTLAVTGESDPSSQAVTRILTVTKDVSPDSAATFSFTVDCATTQLSAASTSPTTGVTFTAGNATFSLGDAGSRVFSGIADDDFCTVAETDPGGTWQTTVNSVAGLSAVIDLANGNGAAQFVNTLPSDFDAYSLTVTKDVIGSAANFGFTVDCAGYDLTTANGTDATYAAGVASFTLGDGGSATLTAIPENTSCDVTENRPAATGLWSTTINGSADPDAATTVVLSQDRTLAFVNTLTAPPPQVHSLTVTKTVVGSSATFPFTVDCDGYDLTATNGSDATYAAGVASFTITDGGSATLTGIPAATSCEVVEDVPTGSNGTWSTTVDGVVDADRRVTTELSGDRTIAFVNTFTPAAVLGGTTERQPTPEPQTAVLGVQLERERTLPATGGPHGLLATTGLALVVAGRAMVLAARPRRRPRFGRRP